jgi:hypothetical protein
VSYSNWAVGQLGDHAGVAGPERSLHLQLQTVSDACRMQYDSE